jgi:hypothetical protein
LVRPQRAANQFPDVSGCRQALAHPVRIAQASQAENLVSGTGRAHLTPALIFEQFEWEELD